MEDDECIMTQVEEMKNEQAIALFFFCLSLPSIPVTPLDSLHPWKDICLGRVC